jgi:hypothetical protein
MRFGLLLLLAAVPTPSLAQEAPPTRRLAFDSTAADTARCGELLYQFVEIRQDPVAGNGFRVLVRNRSTDRIDYDPRQFRARLKTGREVSFLSAEEVATEALDPERSRGMSNDEREQVRRDILVDPRLRRGAVQRGSIAEKFLVLGWGRQVRGEPGALLPITILCNRQPLGRVDFAAEPHH